jgi:RNA polymerase sigma-70 factor (ECF subfamily)
LHKDTPIDWNKSGNPAIIFNMFKQRQRKKQLTRELCANRQRFYKLAYSWCGDAMLADDLVQDAMHKALQSFGSLKDESKLNAWSCRILLNCYRDWLRRQKDTRDIDDFEFVSGEDPLANISSNDTGELVRNCIRRLGQDQRNVITLVDLMEFSYDEVAQALEIPIGTVMSRLCRARNRLKQMLEKQQNDLPLQQTPNLRRVK